MKIVTNTLLLSRINAPEPPSHLLSRPRLLNLIRDNYDKKLILITSPAGYGKTTLALDYLRVSSIDYAWLNISENIDHAYSLFYTIIFSLKKINPSFGEDTLKLLNSHLEKNKFNTNVKDAINDVADTLSNECQSCFIKRTAVVFDDYHHIEGIELKDYLIDSLLKKLPDTMQLIITSRQLPELDFMYYVVNEMMLKIEMEDLVFNNSESLELLRSKYKVDNPVKVTEIIGKLGGWITGLHMVSHGYGGNLDEVKIEKQPIPENIFNFLAEKTFSKFDEQTKEFLLITSVVENFHAGLCAGYLGIKSFDQIVSTLLRNHTFMLTIPMIFEDGSSIVSYNYLNLFRNYLQSKLLELKSTDEVREIYRKTYKYYDGENDTATSINYMIKAEDFGPAAGKINDNFKEMFSEGKIEFLWSWLNALPKVHVESSINSLINLGIVHKFFAGNLRLSLEYFDLALVKAKEEGDNDLLVKAFINRAIIMQNLGSIPAVISELRSLLNDMTLMKYKNSLSYHLAYALFHSSDYLKSEQLLNEIVNSKNDKPEAGLLNSTRKLLGHINLIRGNYKKAVDFYEKAVNDEKNVIDRFEVLCNLTLLSSQSAEYTKAAQFLIELDEMIARFPTAILKIPYLLAQQAFYFESGELDRAIGILMDIHEESKVLNHKQYIFLSSRLITECFYYKHEFEKAKSYYEISEKHLDRNNQLKLIEADISKALLFDLPLLQKERIFLTAYKYYDENSLLYNLSQVCYYLSDLYLKSGSIEKINTYLNFALNTSRLNGYDSFLIREYRNNNQLLEFALNSSVNEGEHDKKHLLEIKQKAS